MKAALVIMVSVLAGLGLLLLLLKLIFSRLRNSLETDIRRRFRGKQFLRKEMWANFVGQKSRRVSLRGNGALVLTEEALCFLMALPRRETIIDLRHVTAVTLPNSFQGRTVFRPILCVEFHSEQGPDAVAWVVPDAKAWKRAIESARGSVGTDVDRTGIQA